MSNGDQNENTDIKPQRSKRKFKTRLRCVDFNKVEDAWGLEDLSTFELEVKEKMAAVPSPLEQLMEKEDREELRRALGKLAKGAGLSPREKVCFRLLYVEGMSVPDAAEKLGLSPITVRRMRQLVITRLRAVVKRKRILPEVLQGKLQKDA